MMFIFYMIFPPIDMSLSIVMLLIFIYVLILSFRNPCFALQRPKM